MAQRRLSLELDLDSGSFTAKMRGASTATETFHKKIDMANDSLKRIDRGVNGATARLRDFTLVMGNLRSAVENTQFFFVGLFQAAVNATAEIERTTFLLRGLSTEATSFGRNLEAQENLESLIETAKRAPFSLKTLSDTFVKFKAGGIDPTTGSMDALIDAVAAFGGTDELLHRASIAIQQMGGKGVISMEELRQQLGEAVPTAINMMAKGLGKSYGDLVKEISLGRVRSAPALQAMFDQFELAFGGSAQRMMETYQGRVSQLKTALMELAMAFTGMDTAGNVEPGSFYDMLKNSIVGLTEAISSEEFQNFASEIGSTMGAGAQAVGTFAAAVKDLGGLLPPIISVRDALLALSLVVLGRLAGAGGAALGKFVSETAAASAATTRQIAVQQQVARDYRIAMVENARLDKANAQAAIANSQARIAQSTRERTALLANIKAVELAQANAVSIATTGRTLGGQFASRASGEAQMAANTAALAQAKQRLSEVSMQLVAATNAETAAKALLSRATQAETAAVAQSTMVKRAQTALTASVSGALAAMNRATLVAVSGARSLTASLVALTTAKGRATAAAAAVSVAQTTMNRVMVAGTVAARGLGSALSFFGGPIGVAIMGAIVGLTYAYDKLKGAMQSAADQQEILSSTTNNSVGALQQVVEYQEAYGIETGRTMSLLEDMLGVTRQSNDLNDAGARAARIRAAQERELAAALLMRNAAEAQSRAAELKRNRDTNLLLGAGLNRVGLTRLGGEAFERAAQNERNAISLWNQAKELYDLSVEVRNAPQGARRDETAQDTSDISSGGGGSRNRRTPNQQAADQLLSMSERLAGINADIAGAGKEAEKMAFVLDRDPVLRQASEEIRNNLMEAARELDAANERLEGSRALQGLREEAEQQEEAIRLLEQEIGLIAAGMEDGVLQNARFTAGLLEATNTASKFNAEEAEAARDRAANAQRAAQQLERQRDAMLDITNAVRSTRIEADYAWEDYLSGATETDRSINRLRRTLTEQLGLIPEGTEKWVQMDAAARAALDNARAAALVETLQEMDDEIKELNRTFLTTAQAARAAFEQEAARRRAEIDNSELSGERRLAAERSYYDWKNAKERELLFSNPIGDMALEWADAFGNLQQATSGWVDSLVDGLFEGQMNFKEFTKSILKEIAKIILRAMIAQAVMSAIGGGTGTLTLGARGNPAADLTGLYHTGGIVGSLARAPGRRSVSPSMFYAAPKFHGGGIVGGLKKSEVPAILEKKEGVFTPEQMRALAPVGSLQAAPPNVQVNVINESGTPMDAQQSGGMRFDGRGYILDVVIDAASKPGKMRDALKGVGR